MISIRPPSGRAYRYLNAASLHAVLSRAAASGIPVEQRRQGEELHIGAARIHVLHPPSPDWERQRVRNDDSVVLEVAYGDVAFLLTGDIGSDVERAIAPHLVPAKIRILKVAHHGSRTSTSQELLEACIRRLRSSAAGGESLRAPRAGGCRKARSIRRGHLSDRSGRGDHG